MTIYILGDKTHEELDDESLGEMISACAQALVNVHWFYFYTYAVCTTPENPPLKATEQDKWSRWARECLANYNALLAHAQACCEEYEDRFRCFRCSGAGVELNLGEWGDCPACNGGCSKPHKRQQVIEWCEQNKPDLCKWRTDTMFPESAQPWPLVMPEEYFVYTNDLIKSKSYVKPECNPYKSFEHELNVIESYRNYYRAKITERINKKVFKLVKDSKLDELCKKEFMPTWTRRSKPEWLEDL
jgi:hypothetical protein